MEQSKVTAKVILDTRREKLDGSYPLKLRVTYQREFRDYKLGIDISQVDYDQMLNPKNRTERLRELKLLIQTRENEAQAIIRSLSTFTFKVFKNQITRNQVKKTPDGVYGLMEQYIEELREDGRISTATSYHTALNSLKGFTKKLRFEDIDIDFLKRYEHYLLRQGRSITTVGIYLRSFRIVVNKAITKGYILRENYPFLKGRYVIPAGRNVKKALKLSQIGEVYNFETVDGTNQDRAKDLWFFSYLCNGLNVKDICRLKYGSVIGSTITVIRAKTELTTRGSQLPISINLSKIAFDIIEKWGNENLSKNTYVFPFLNDVKGPEDERNKVQLLTQNINKHMKRIGEALGFVLPLTTYVARHSYSTVLRRSKIPIDDISEALGHRNRKTTQNYLDSIDDEDREQYSKLLMNFPTPSPKEPISTESEVAE